MESLPQELIDKVIDILPHSSLYPCSLVGRRWRRRSQELFFALVTFRSERSLVLWCTNIPQDPGGIPSYVRSAEFHDIHFSREPALFGRILKTFTSMTSLEITIADLPSSLPFGEFGRNIEYLVLLSPRCTVATIRALVFSLPNLESFSLFGGVRGDPFSENPLSILPHAPQRRQLVELKLYGTASGVGIALAECGFTSRKLSTSVSGAGLEQLLTLSSEVIVELQLYGM
jgi:hypothetical protein